MWAPLKFENLCETRFYECKFRAFWRSAPQNALKHSLRLCGSGRALDHSKTFFWSEGAALDKARPYF